MSYRRPEDPGHAYSSHFRVKHRRELTECGVPDEIADSDSRWKYVFLHGADVPGGTGWSTSWISVRQAEILLKLLIDNGCEVSGSDLLYDLQQRVNPSRA